MNPLWIISLFLGLSEVTVGLAATRSQGWVQILLAAFATGFPLLVSAAFFWIVWAKPYVLYAPGDFSEQTPVTAYVQAMHHSSPVPASALEDAARVAVESAISRFAEPDLTPAERGLVVNYAVEEARKDIEERAIHVDVRSLGTLGGTVEISVPTFNDMTVSGFLDNLWFQINDVLPRRIPPFTFGRVWALREVGSGTLLTDLGSQWADRHDLLTDDRLLESVGLSPGSSLTAVILHPDSAESHESGPTVKWLIPELPS